MKSKTETKRVADLEGRDLDRWVAEALGYVWVDVSSRYKDGDKSVIVAPEFAQNFLEFLVSTEGNPPRRGICWDASLPPFSQAWRAAGPIIERERIGLHPLTRLDGHWQAAMVNWDCSILSSQTGPTPLIAAMRAFVASKFGDEVPDEVTP